MSYTVDAQTFLKFSQLPWFTGWEGVCVCVECGGVVKKKEGKEKCLSCLSSSQNLSVTLLYHDYWVKTHISSLRCYHLINLVRIID